MHKLNWLILQKVVLSESEVHTEEFDLVSIRKKGNLLTKRL